VAHDSDVNYKYLLFDICWPIACTIARVAIAQVADWFTNWRARVWKHQLPGALTTAGDQPSLWQRTRCKLLAMMVFLEIYRHVKGKARTGTATTRLQKSLCTAGQKPAGLV
jgi:hypothetical protein